MFQVFLPQKIGRSVEQGKQDELEDRDQVKGEGRLEVSRMSIISLAERPMRVAIQSY